MCMRVCVQRTACRQFSRMKPSNGVTSLWECPFLILLEETEESGEVRRMRRYGEHNVPDMENKAMTYNGFFASSDGCVSGRTRS